MAGNELSPNKIIVSPKENKVLVTTKNEKIIVGAVGARGPKGDKGDITSFDISQVSFTYEKQSSSTSWTINHNLRFRPAVIVMDYGTNNIECDIRHVNENQVVLTFSEAISGYAYLS